MMIASPRNVVKTPMTFGFTVSENGGSFWAPPGPGVSGAKNIIALEEDGSCKQPKRSNYDAGVEVKFSLDQTAG
jgi:hypothetical protein